MPRPARRTARSLAATAVAAGWLALVIGGGGCEVAVGDTVPAFACEQGAGDTCPINQMCDSTNRCVPCPASGCGSMMTVDSGIGTEVSVNDTGAPPDTSMSMPDTSTVPDTSMPVDTGTVEAGCGGAVGCACSGNVSCTSDVCGTEAAVTAGLFTAAGGSAFCSQGCCTSADCPSGWVCYATSAGGNYCVQPSWVGRTNGVGSAAAGATCSNGRDCRSGLCAGNCLDTCCSGQATGQCSGGTVCTFSAFAGAATDDKNFAASCGASAGTGGNGHSCTGNGECESQICGADTMFGNAYCHSACRSASDCTGTCDGSPCACTYVLPNGGTGGLIAVCAGSTGNTPEGQSCSPTNDTCATGFCDPTSSQCSSVCFTDADCTTAGWKCRPVQVMLSSGGSFTVLACGT